MCSSLPVLKNLCPKKQRNRPITPTTVHTILAARLSTKKQANYTYYCTHNPGSKVIYKETGQLHLLLYTQSWQQGYLQRNRPITTTTVHTILAARLSTKKQANYTNYCTHNPGSKVIYKETGQLHQLLYIISWQQGYLQRNRPITPTTVHNILAARLSTKKQANYTNYCTYSPGSKVIYKETGQLHQLLYTQSWQQSYSIYKETGQ
ncbi:unnamed protein product [Owenia fusiformis]|uniref:Uncharacterized protein n=1 Tax=Owenia fusiformis TaxID=6347 RepID=A0A8J1YCT1_OWEFU|nr:unnamed protein product [Owenia fusiformis]